MEVSYPSRRAKVEVTIMESKMEDRAFHDGFSRAEAPVVFPAGNGIAPATTRSTGGTGHPIFREAGDLTGLNLVKPFYGYLRLL